MASPTEDARAEINGLLVRPDPIPTTPIAVVNWVLHLLLAIIRIIFKHLDIIVAAINERLPSPDDPDFDAYVNAITGRTLQPPTVPPSTTPAPTRTPRTGRCDRCHATGHNTAECRTKDPKTTKKRVAKNNRDRRKVVVPPPLPFSYAAPPPFVPQLPTSSLPPAFMQAMTDATEYRRRAAQSKRDKQANRRKATAAAK